MKLATQAIERFLARPDPAIATVLVYGPDAGLVTERVRRLARHVVEDLEDPFRVSELTGEEVRIARGRLIEEAQALCLMGGRRLVRVREAGDGATEAVRDLLALPNQAAFVLLEAGDLAGNSSLRRLIEQAPQAAALPCYRGEGTELAAQIRGLLTERGLHAPPEVLTYLQSHLGADRGVTRMEIDKLALYLADRPRAPIALEDAAAVIGDASALAAEDALHAAVLGRRGACERALDRLFAEGESPVRLIRAAAGLLVRLARLEASVAAGRPVKEVVDGARPPIFFRHRDVFARALRHWRAGRIARGLAVLHNAELRCKTAGSQDALICRAALGQLAALAATTGELAADGRAEAG